MLDQATIDTLSKTPVAPVQNLIDGMSCPASDGAVMEVISLSMKAS